MNSLVKLFLCALFLSSLSRPSGAQSFSPSVPPPSQVSPADKLWEDARLAFESRQYQDAQKKFEDFIRRHLNDPRAQESRIYVGICDYRQKRVVKALDAWNRVVSMEVMQKSSSPTLLLALDQLAAHHRSEGKPEDWWKTIDQLAEFFPENPVTIRELRLLARQCLVKGDYAQALAVYGRFEKQLNVEDR